MIPTRLKIAALFLWAALLPEILLAQTSLDVPHTMSYQGQVTNTSNGSAMNGQHTITATLYTNAYGGHSIWQGQYSAEITNGIFTILLGSGKSPLPEVTTMSRPLWVGISVDNGTEMKPLTQLSGVPYALNIPDQSVTLQKLAPEVVNSIGSGKNPTPQNANSPVYWSETGNNSTVPGTNYVGTSDSVALELHVYDGDATASRGSKRVMRFEPNASSANIIAGFQGNNVQTGKVGSVVAGGGAYTDTNQSKSNYTNIGGGINNFIDSNSDYSIIAGGNANEIHANSSNGFIAGDSNVIHPGVQNATIIGNSLHITSYGETDIGRYNTPAGGSRADSIWRDNYIFRIGNGTGDANRSDAFGVSNNGHSEVHHTLGGTFDSATGGGVVRTYVDPVIVGGTYMDNIIYAWGFYDGGTLVSSFGVDTFMTVSLLSGPAFYITLATMKSNDSATCLNDKDAAVLVTPYSNAQNCGTASVQNLTNNSNSRTSFNIQWTHPILVLPHMGQPNYTLDCGVYAGQDFMFMVVGRPLH